MDREILFRAKFGNDWKYGYLSVEPKGLVIKEPYELNQSNIWHINPETVGQYTGLTDKNGTKIFEGDIVKDEQSGYEYVIKWFSEYACFALANKNGHIEYDVDEFEMLVNDLIVVGNIHDSSDFAEVSK